MLTVIVVIFRANFLLQFLSKKYNFFPVKIEQKKKTFNNNLRDAYHVVLYATVVDQPFYPTFSVLDRMFSVLISMFILRYNISCACVFVSDEKYDKMTSFILTLICLMVRDESENCPLRSDVTFEHCPHNHRRSYHNNTTTIPNNTQKCITRAPHYYHTTIIPNVYHNPTVINMKTFYGWARALDKLSIKFVTSYLYLYDYK